MQIRGPFRFGAEPPAPFEWSWWYVLGCVVYTLMLLGIPVTAFLLVMLMMGVR